MSNCIWCKWVGGIWKCTKGIGMMASEFCNSRDISADTARDYCADYEERYY